MRHAFSFPIEVRQAVREYVQAAVDGLSSTSFQQEPAYVAALLGRLNGEVYEGREGLVHFRATNVDSIGPGAAEGWSGADFAITADIRREDNHIDKAILGQAKRGGLDDLPKSELVRLVEQIGKMREFTRSPKVLFLPKRGSNYAPEIASGVRLVESMHPVPVSLADHFVRRVLTTLDGDTRSGFVAAVQESSLSQLKVIATIR